MPAANKTPMARSIVAIPIMVKTDTILKPAFGFNMLTTMSTPNITIPRMNWDIGSAPGRLPGSASPKKLWYPSETPTDPTAKIVVRTVKARNARVCRVNPMSDIAAPNGPPRFLEIHT